MAWAFGYLSDTPCFHPSGAGGGFNRFAHSARPGSDFESLVGSVSVGFKVCVYRVKGPYG